MAPRKGPGENDYKGGSFVLHLHHKPQVVKNGTFLGTMHLRKIKKMPVSIIFKGSFAIFVVNPLFSNHNLFKTARNVRQIQCFSAHLIKTQC